MRTTTLGRLLGAAALAGSFTLVAAGTASASTPNWSMQVVDLPGTVHNGANAGYQITVSNGGPSNISQLYLVTRTTDSPSYVVTSQGSCSAVGAGPLKCSFGALTAGSSLSVTVAYTTPATGSSYDPGFEVNSNGLTFSDPNHTSHGDTLVDPNETATVLTNSGDFGGGFSITTGTVQDDQTLGKNNVQSTAVGAPGTGIVTVQDGPNLTATCTGCTGTFGEWSKINVNNGQVLPNGGLFSVTVMVYGKSVPSGATVDNIGLYHLPDGSTTPVNLTTRCGTTPTANCITVTKVGSNWKIVAWLNQNGGVKGHL
jgi:hypothetical protein